jgi:hypothetical protein
MYSSSAGIAALRSVRRPLLEDEPGVVAVFEVAHQHLHDGADAHKPKQHRGEDGPIALGEHVAGVCRIERREESSRLKPIERPGYGSEPSSVPTVREKPNGSVDLDARVLPQLT